MRVPLRRVGGRRAIAATAILAAALVLVAIVGRQGAPAPVRGDGAGAESSVPEPLAAVLAHRPTLLLPRWRAALEVAASDQLDAAAPLVAIGLHPGDRLVLVARCAASSGRLVGAVLPRPHSGAVAVRADCGRLLQQPMPVVEGDQLAVAARTGSGAEWSGVLLRLPRR